MKRTGNSLDAPARRRAGRRSTGVHLPALPALAALTASLLLVVACGSSDANSGDNPPADGTQSAAEPLGPSAPAEGAPVKIGMISDGKGPVSDLSVESDVADATVAYLNEHRSGVAGRPVELVKCEALADPAIGTDCANRMVEEGVVAVVVGSSSVVESIWEPLHAAGVPVMFHSASGAPLGDSESTFALTDSSFSLIDFPIQVAKDEGAEKVTAVTIDVPSAIGIYQTAAPPLFEEAGIELEVVPIPPGTADMTPQMQALVAGDPGIVQVVGNDAFCIAAFNGLHAVGFTGTVTGVSQCISDRTREAVPGDVLEGMLVPATVPLGVDNPSTRLFNAVATTYGEDVDTSRVAALSMFTVLAAFQTATGGISGDVTPETVIAAIKAMPETDLPGAGGLRFRCNGKADATMPAVCVRGGLVTTLDSEGQPSEYEAVGVTPIED